MRLALIGSALLLLVILIALALWRRSPNVRVGGVYTAGELKEKYGFTADARPEIDINPDNVPEHLRDLIPMAEQWGIGDDVIRDDYEDKATQAEKDAFRAALRGRTAQVTAWLDSFGDGVSEDAVPFMYMLEALDEMGLWPD